MVRSPSFFHPLSATSLSVLSTTNLEDSNTISVGLPRLSSILLMDPISSMLNSSTHLYFPSSRNVGLPAYAGSGYKIHGLPETMMDFTGSLKQMSKFVLN